MEDVISGATPWEFRKPDRYKQEFLEQEWIIEQNYKQKQTFDTGYLSFPIEVSCFSHKLVEHVTPDCSEGLPDVEYTEEDMVELLRYSSERNYLELYAGLDVPPVEIKKVK